MKDHIGSLPICGLINPFHSTVALFINYVFKPDPFFCKDQITNLPTHVLPWTTPTNYTIMSFALLIVGTAEPECSLPFIALLLFTPLGHKLIYCNVRNNGVTNLYLTCYQLSGYSNQTEAILSCLVCK